MIKIDGMEFEPIPGVNYKHDYVMLAKDIALGKIKAIPAYRYMVLNDLWVVVYFIFKMPNANHPFWVDACREVEVGPKSHTLDIWGRFHGKTSIITRAESLKKILRDGERRISYFSHTRPAAKDILRSIKILCEQSEFLKDLFPDRLYRNPEVQSPKWSEDDGLIFKRKGFYRESSLEAWGLFEGMPQGKHFTDRYYDDIETIDVSRNPDMIIKIRAAFDLSRNLRDASPDSIERIVGTYFTHDGVITHLEQMKDINGKPKYFIRKKPSTINGERDGKPVYLEQSVLDDYKTDEYNFNCQHLLNPTPMGCRRLDSLLLKNIEFEKIPKNLWKFLIIDPAGDKDKARKTGDSWAIGLVGVEPQSDSYGLSNRYILDFIVEPMPESQAYDVIARMYLKWGVVMKVGIENWGRAGIETHVANILAKHGRMISEASGTLEILKPAGRNKNNRIMDALNLPFINGKIYISSYVDKKYQDRLRSEMDKFPHWHDDGLDMLSYLDDMIKDYRFGDETKLKPIEYPVDSLI